jgi:DUF4097 and DUF4098 domain-containing protein YvlB
MREVTKIRIVVLAVLATFLFACGPAASADSWNKNYKVTGHAQLRVDSNDGSMEVTAATSSAIAARVETSGWAINAHEVTITDHQNGDTVEIQIHVPQGNFPFFGGMRHGSVHVYLQVPSLVDLDVHTGDGDIEARDVTGAIRLDSGDGHLRAENLHGELRLHCGDGRIEGSGLDGNLDANSGDGSLLLSGRFERVNAYTGDGSIDLAVQSGSKMSGPWELRTGDGRVHLRLPDGFNALLDAHTGDGRVTTEFPISFSGSTQSSTLRGKLNEGGESLTIRSGDGSIYIEKI